MICFLIVINFNPHLKKILLGLNGDKERPANFWVAYTTIILMLIPLIFAIWIIPDDEDVSIFFQISNQLKWALMGLVTALVIIGILIIRFVPGDKTYHEKKGLAASLHQELEIKLSLLAVHSYRYHD